MSSNSYLFLVFICTAAAAFFAYCAKNAESAEKKVKETAATEAQNEVVRLMKALAAQGGDTKAQRDLAELQLLRANARRTGSDDAIDQLLVDLPLKQAQYRQATETREREFAEASRKFLIAWEPTINFAIAEFDRRVAKLQQKGIKLTIEDTGAPVLITTPGQLVNCVSLRTAKVGHSEVYLRFDRFNPRERRESTLSIETTAQSSPRQNHITFTGSYAEWSDKPDSVVRIPAPSDGAVDQKLGDFIGGLILTVIESALTAEGSK